MAVNDILYSHLNPLQCVPINQVRPPQFNTYDRNLFLFKDQVGRWLNRDGYCNPVRIGDPVCMQFITHSLDPLTYTVYRSDLTVYAGPTNLDTITTNYPSPPLILWQKYVDTTGWPPGRYFFVCSGTTGDQYISECINVQAEHPDTVLIRVRNSFNTQEFIFNSLVPFKGFFRVKGGYDNNFVQKHVGREFIDQGQNAYYLNDMPYEVGNFFIANVPDYVAKKVSRYLRLDGCEIDGEGFSANPGSEMERVFTKGAPKKIYMQEIRPTVNRLSTVVNAGVDTDAGFMIRVDAVGFGPNIENSSGSADPVLVDIEINP